MGYVYKYTHKENKKYYIGSHNGNKPGYTGSGLLWQHAKKKYGIESFDREILYEGENYREIEQQILEELNCANDPLSYNMKNQSLGGTFFGESNGMYGKKLSEEHKYKCGSAFRGKKRPDHSLKMSGKNNPVYGKNFHTHGLKKYNESRLGKTLEEFHGKEKAALLRDKLSKSKLGIKHNLKSVECPHCKKVGAGPNMTRYHFDKCKFKDATK